MEETSNIILDRFHIIGTCLVWALGATWFAYRADFFKMSRDSRSGGYTVTFGMVFFAFMIFLAVQIVSVNTIELGRLLLSSKKGAVPELDKLTELWYGLLGICAGGMCLLGYTYTRPSVTKSTIWGSAKTFPLKELAVGMAIWLLAYPVIMMVSQMISIAVHLVYTGPFFEQVAVRQIKEAMDHPVLFFGMLLAVTVVVPLIEELLFRGYLQSWLKEQIDWQSGIIITSAIFALFHVSSSQGINNIEIFISLFILSCFLGYAFERRQSLWAPIGLHIAFNTISSAIILSKEL